MVRFAKGSAFVRLNAMAFVSMTPGTKELSAGGYDRMVEAVTRDSAAVAEQYTDERGLAFEIATNLATARA